MKSYDSKAQAQLRRISKRNVIDGAYYEPRAYYDYFDFAPNAVKAFKSPETFRNRSPYPIRITHIVASMGVGQGDAVSPGTLPQGDERLIQQFAMRILGHDTSYMAEQFIPIPVWNNKPTGSAAPFSPGNVSWLFDQILKYVHTDTLAVDVSLASLIGLGNGVRVGVGWEGYGRLSGRPYEINTQSGVINTQQKTSLDRDETRQEGAEPMHLTQMSAFVSGPVNGDSSGEARNVLMQIRQTGNGTQEEWFKGPNDEPRMPMDLFGTEVTRAVVHELPWDFYEQRRGWVWYPGQGVDPELINLDARSVSERVWLAFLGYAIVT